MKVLHVISGMNLASGGPPQSIYNLVNELLKNEIDTTVLTLRQKRNNQLVSEDEFIIKVGKPITNNFAYSSYFKKEISKFRNVDLIHAHGLWQYPPHYSLKFAFKHNIPSVISPRGMLYPEALKKSKLIKKILLFTYQYGDLKNATLIQATCIQEKDHLRKLGLKSPISVIPHSVLFDFENCNAPEKLKNRIGFIGRLNSIKNIESLLLAWKEIERDNNGWELVIVGDGPTKYKNHLKRLEKRMEIKNIVWCGHLIGREKNEIFSTFKYLILPSFSENFGMVVAESLARKIPVIASKGTPWEELTLYNAGWWIDRDEISIANTLRKAMKLDEDIRLTMGENGRNLILKNYNSATVAAKMIKMYKWILNGGQKPNFIYTN